MSTMLAPLAMSDTKEALLKHLNLPANTYAAMAKETERFYDWLTSQKMNLKNNCKRKPPYDWSDIQEKAKDEAIIAIANGGDKYTAYYWQLARPTSDCPNWIARWFLYHKFRYRDGRNRHHDKADSGKRHHKSSEHTKRESGLEGTQPSNAGSVSGSEYHDSHPDTSGQYVNSSYGPVSYAPPLVSAQTTRYDPVRDRPL